VAVVARAGCPTSPSSLTPETVDAVPDASNRTRGFTNPALLLPTTRKSNLPCPRRVRHCDTDMISPRIVVRRANLDVPRAAILVPTRAVCHKRQSARGDGMQ
jgi:hypothetical protein